MKATLGAALLIAIGASRSVAQAAPESTPQAQAHRPDGARSNAVTAGDKPHKMGDSR